VDLGTLSLKGLKVNNKGIAEEQGPNYHNFNYLNEINICLLKTKRESEAKQTEKAGVLGNSRRPFHVVLSTMW
jgi:hypothetical protein